MLIPEKFFYVEMVQGGQKAQPELILAARFTPMKRRLEVHGFVQGC